MLVARGRPEAWSLGTRALGPLVVRAIAPLAALLLEGWGAALGALLIQEFGLQYLPYRQRVLQIINDTRREAGLPPVADH